MSGRRRRDRGGDERGRARPSGAAVRGDRGRLFAQSAGNEEHGGDQRTETARSYHRRLRSGESPFDRVHGMNVWEWFAEHPDEQEMFAHGMMGLTTQHAPVIAALYPFAEVKSVCDVGGGRGALLSELLLRHPHLRGVLADGAGVLASAEVLLAARGVKDRVELAVSSFFDEVPAGADA